MTLGGSLNLSRPPFLTWDVWTVPGVMRIRRSVPKTLNPMSGKRLALDKRPPVSYAREHKHPSERCIPGEIQPYGWERVRVTVIHTSGAEAESVQPGARIHLGLWEGGRDPEGNGPL